MSRRKTILLVDDVRLFLEMEKSFFARQNFEVVSATNGAEALKLVRALRPDLVLMDLNMPEMDGVACCRAIKQDPRLAGIPVILVSGERGAALARCQGSGCDALLSKPLNRRKLLETVREFIHVSERSSARRPVKMLVHYGVAPQLALHDYTVNLGGGGIFIATERILPVGTPLTLEFFVPSCEETILCKGRVAWVNAAASRDKPELPAGFGVEFQDLEPGEVEMIRDYLAGAGEA